MMRAAMDFAAARHRRVRLGSFDALHAARHLYEEFGFRKALERDSTEWGPPVREQHWEWTQ
jgi:hypothetical protein